MTCRPRRGCEGAGNGYVRGDPLERCRNIPLDRVAAALGYRQDPADRARFKREGPIISINGEKFFVHLRGSGGGGAIDLVIHATRWRFAHALRFLEGRERWGNTTAIPAGKRRLRLPSPSHRAWPKVRDALVRQRALSADVLEGCLSRGVLYADDRLNAVFVCRNASANPTGAEIIGTAAPAGTKRFRGMLAASGSPATDTGPRGSSSRRAPSMPSPLEACASSEPVNPAPSSPQPPASSARSRPGSNTGSRSASSVPTTPTAPVTLPPFVSP